jgi:hypothetical protein
MNETKDTVVCANARLDPFQFKPQTLLRSFLDLDIPEFTGGFDHSQHNFGFKPAEVEVVIEDIFDGLTADSQDAVPSFDPHFLGNRT